MIVGVLGGGQLGRMLALAGIPLGLRFRFLDPDPDCPASHVGEMIVGEFDDPVALSHLARDAALVTYEFENVPAAAVDFLQAKLPVYPPRGALAVSQDRLSEKNLFRELRIATPEFAPVDSLESLHAAVDKIGLPAVLKTRRFGYDGKGQAVLRERSHAHAAFEELAHSQQKNGHRVSLILEAFVPFAREVSVIAVRSRDGRCAFYDPIENVHSKGILARSTAPALRMSESQAARYEDAAKAVLERLEYVGVLTIEFFEMPGGAGAQILANEMAPRVHNSGHWTIEGAVTSQFENHIRAVCGMPLGSTAARGRSVMLNIIGAEPDVPKLLAQPSAHLHMYSKQPRPGRKLGHVTVCETDLGRLESSARAAAACLRNC